MGSIVPFNKEKLIAGVLFSADLSADSIPPYLEDAWGKIDHASPAVPFDFTDYYDREMGEGISRVYLSFEKLLTPDNLSRIKIESNTLEERFLSGESRKVNIDPGFLSLTRLTLASTKDAGHRIPLTDGIYAEVTLTYQSGGFQTLKWTYPDYGTPFCREEMKKIREIYKKQLKS